MLFNYNFNRKNSHQNVYIGIFDKFVFFESYLWLGLEAFQFLCWPKHTLRVKKQHFLPGQCLPDLFPPYIPHIAPNMAPYEAILRVGLKAFPGFEF